MKVVWKSVVVITYYGSSAYITVCLPACLPHRSVFSSLTWWAVSVTTYDTSVVGLSRHRWKYSNTTVGDPPSSRNLIDTRVVPIKPLHNLAHRNMEHTKRQPVQTRLHRTNWMQYAASRTNRWTSIVSIHLASSPTLLFEQLTRLLVSNKSESILFLALQPQVYRQHGEV